MDLSVSPDLPAVYCYLVVAALAALAARSQVGEKMSPYKGVWIMAETWALFFAFIGVPVILFWLLDRTGAIHDTSLFAAVLVGLLYRQLLGGSSDVIKVNPSLQSFWKPFNAWSDRLAVRIGARIQRRDNRLQERVVADLAGAEQDLVKLRELVMTRLPEDRVADLAKRLKAAEDRFRPFGKEAEGLNLAKILYEEARGIEDFEFLLHEQRLMTSWSYYWYAQEWRSKAFTISIALVFLICVGLVRYRIEDPDWIIYYSWRLQKPNTTEHSCPRTESRKWLQ